MSIASYLNLYYQLHNYDSYFGDIIADYYAMFVCLLVGVFFPLSMVYVALVPVHWLHRPDFKQKWRFLYNKRGTWLGLEDKYPLRPVLYRRSRILDLEISQTNLDFCKIYRANRDLPSTRNLDDVYLWLAERARACGLPRAQTHKHTHKCACNNQPRAQTHTCATFRDLKHTTHAHTTHNQTVTPQHTTDRRTYTQTTHMHASTPLVSDLKIIIIIGHIVILLFIFM